VLDERESRPIAIDEVADEMVVAPKATLELPEADEVRPIAIPRCPLALAPATVPVPDPIATVLEFVALAPATISPSLPPMAIAPKAVAVGAVIELPPLPMAIPSIAA